MEREYHPLKLIAGNSHPTLANLISDHLGAPLTPCDVSHFSNGETSVTIKESIRDCDIFIIQSLHGTNLNDYLMELLVLADAVRRASAYRIHAVVPYFAYARQNSKEKSRIPIACKLIANLMVTSGIDQIITMDLSASQIQGFFDVPVDNMYAESLFVKYIGRQLADGEKVVVSPSVDGVKRAKIIADKIDCNLAILNKSKNAEGDTMVLVGDVKGKIALVIGDIVDTFITLELASEVLVQSGAVKVYALVSHAVLSQGSIPRVNTSKLTELIVTNSIPLR